MTEPKTTIETDVTSAPEQPATTAGAPDYVGGRTEVHHEGDGAPVDVKVTQTAEDTPRESSVVEIDGKPAKITPRVFASLEEADKALANAQPLLEALGFRDYVLSVSSRVVCADGATRVSIASTWLGELPVCVRLAMHANRHVLDGVEAAELRNGTMFEEPAPGSATATTEGAASAGTEAPITP